MSEEIPPPDDTDAPPGAVALPKPSRPANPIVGYEAALLSGMLISATACEAANAAGLQRDAFIGNAHPEIFDACMDLWRAGDNVDFLTVDEMLRNDKSYRHVGGIEYLERLHRDDTPAIKGAATYADRIREAWTTRFTLHQLADAGPRIAAGEPARNVITSIIDRLPVDNHELRHRTLDGAAFLLDEPDKITSVWGEGDTSLWAEGEATMIVGPTGIGKTTLCQQVVLGRIGLRDTVLGQPVTQTSERVLYLACDRPRQASRSMSRMVTEADREILEERLTAWKGPLPFDIVADPYALKHFARNLGADTVIIDSLKDVCYKLNDDEAASRTNAAIQECVAAGIEVGVLHHQRKNAAGTKKETAPKTIDEVYGNTWLTAGMGSVILVWGQAGDTIIELSHLKSPGEQVGPWTLRMDFDRGYTTIEEEASVIQIVNGATRGVTVNLVARVMFKADEPTRNQIEKARRKLERLAEQGLVHREETPTEGGGKPTALYYPIDTRRTA